MEKHVHVINKEKLDGLNLIDNETIEEMAVLFKMFGRKYK